MASFRRVLGRAAAPFRRAVGGGSADAPGLRKRLRRAERRIDRLRQQVGELSLELADARRQGRRAAELADLVTELLANEASRRDPEFQRILQRYVAP